MKIGLIILGVVILLLIIYVISIYNSLVSLKNKVKDGWAQIDVYLKRRFDLIPNLVETVKGYAKHEKTTFEDVVKARNSFQNADTPEKEMKVANELSNAVTKLFALAESYPELKSNENFLNLQNELKETEDKISYARQFYNDIVMNYNNKIEMFPSNVVANIFNIKSETFFEASEVEKKCFS